MKSFRTLIVWSLAACAPVCYVAFSSMFIMPGESYRGSLSALTAEQRDVAKRISSDVQALAGRIGARSLTRSPDGLELAAKLVENEFEKAGYHCEKQEYAVDSDVMIQRQRSSRADGSEFDVVGKKCRNIIATLPGTDKPDEIVVIGAHYDSVFDCPAANDNATGVACMLELAREFSHAKLAKTVRFVAFPNEEPPFFRSNDMGSYRYAKRCAERKEKIVAMFSLETMGYYTDQPNSQKYPQPLASMYPSTGNFISFVGNTTSSKLVHQCVGVFRKAVKFPCEGIAAPEAVQGIDFSDQQAFWHYGYPAVMVTDTALLRYPYYHKKEDTPDKVSYEKIAQVMTGLAAVVKNVAQ